MRIATGEVEEDAPANSASAQMGRKGGAARADRVHLYAMIVLLTCLRSEAVLEPNAGQIEVGVIYSNRAGGRQSSKRRAKPVCATSAPWLDGSRAKVIAYGVARSARPADVARAGEAAHVRPTS